MTTNVLPGEIAAALEQSSPEFAEVWTEHEVGLRYGEQKRLVHPELGDLELHCQTLVEAQSLLVFSAVPGSESYEKLQLLSVIGAQKLDI